MARAPYPSPLCGGGYPAQQGGEGSDASIRGAALMKASALAGTVAPLSRALLTQGPPSPAEGGGREAAIVRQIRTHCA